MPSASLCRQIRPSIYVIRAIISSFFFNFNTALISYVQGPGMDKIPLKRPGVCIIWKFRYVPMLSQQISSRRQKATREKYSRMKNKRQFSRLNPLDRYENLAVVAGLRLYLLDCSAAVSLSGFSRQNPFTNVINIVYALRSYHHSVRQMDNEDNGKIVSTIRICRYGAECLNSFAGLLEPIHIQSCLARLHETRIVNIAHGDKCT